MTRRLDTDTKKMLCYCLGVRYGRVIDAVRDPGCRTVQQVTRRCKAGGGCRSCHPEIEELLAEAQAERRAAGGGIKRVLAHLFGRRS